MTGTIVAGVMGWPVAHSRSPLLHGTWLRRYGIAGAYVPFAVRPERLEAALRALPALGIAGVNLTVPHKEAAARIVDRLDPAAARTGSVNMVTVAEDGSLDGASADGYGFMASLAAAVPDREIAAGPVALIGAGGAARAIADALLASGEHSIRVVNRTKDRAEKLAADLSLSTPQGAERERLGAVDAVPWTDLHAALDGAALLVNTTTLGMTGQPPLDIDLSALPRHAIVVDIVYVPLETRSLPRRAGSVIAPSTASVCSSTKRARPSRAGSVSIP